MNTEKSIKLMNIIKAILPEHYNFDFGKPEIDEVIKRLQRGEKFENMWEELESIASLGDIFTFLPDDIENKGLYITAILKAFLSIKQKYFPKPKIRKEIRVEVLAENEEVIGHLAKWIEGWDKTFDAGKISVVATRWEKE